MRGRANARAERSATGFPRTSTCSPTRPQLRPEAGSRPGPCAPKLRLWFCGRWCWATPYRIALRRIKFAEVTCDTIRLRLFTIGALVPVSVRGIKVAMASACPYQNEFALAYLPPDRRGPLTTQSRHRGTDHLPTCTGPITPAMTRPGCAPPRSPLLRAPHALHIRHRYEKSGLARFIHRGFETTVPQRAGGAVFGGGDDAALGV
jgi:Transposase DDE domain group 1